MFMNKRKQAGISPLTVLLVGGILAFLFIIGARCVPVINEYFNIKRVITQVAQNADPNTATVAELRRDFEKRAYIDDVKSVKPSDLQISKQEGKVVIEVSYQAVVPVAGVVSLLFDFSASSAQ